jgi:CRP/FNR family transcriptional regulator, cyclic AMP receptor protein
LRLDAFDFDGRKFDSRDIETGLIFVPMASRSSRGKSTRQRGARPPQPRAVSAQDLGKLQGLAGLSPRKLEALRARMRIRQFSKHSIVYKEGESDDAVYIVLSGIARLVCLNRKGKRNLLEVLGPGDVIEIPSLLPDIHNKLTCETFTDCQIGLIGPTALVEGIVGIPFREFNEALNLTVGRWWTLLERHSNFLSQTVREKIMLALLDLGRKFGQRDDHAMIVDLGLSGQDIADLVESSRPKVSECLKRLVAEGIVKREHRRFIIDSVKIQANLRS